jgi:hypothetical protein
MDLPDDVLLRLDLRLLYTEFFSGKKPAVRNGARNSPRKECRYPQSGYKTRK